MKNKLILLLVFIMFCPLKVNALTGQIKIWSDDTIPSGYLLCDGRAVSRTTYVELFKIIGTTYGAGDGSTTFNLPNMQGKNSIGKSTSKTIGSTGGRTSVSLTASNMPSHSHNFTPSGSIASPFTGTAGTSGSGGSHAHDGLNWSYETSSSYSYASGGSYWAIHDPTFNGTLNTTSAGAHTHTFTPSGSVTSTFTGTAGTTLASGSGNAVNIQNPYVAVNYIIKY